MEEEIVLEVSEIESFVKTRVWKVMVTMMIERTNGKMEENNTIDPFKDPTALCRNQGYLEAMHDIVDYPAILKSTAIFNKREEEKRNG